MKSVFQECPETPMALTLLLIKIIFLPLGKISYLLVCKDGFTRVNHDWDKLPIQEPTDTNYMMKKKNTQDVLSYLDWKPVEKLKILLRDLAKSWLSKAKFAV